MEQAIKVVIADDDGDMRDVLAWRLTNEGFHVIVADNGEHAVRCALQEHPDVVVLDALMPVVDGFQACLCMRNNPQFAGLPIILFSGVFTDVYEQRFGISVGADVFISKLGGVQALVNIIHGLTDRKLCFGHHLVQNKAVLGQIRREVRIAMPETCKICGYCPMMKTTKEVAHA